MKIIWKPWIVYCLGMAIASGLAGAQEKSSLGAPIGAFQDHGDVGTVLHPGSVNFDAEHGTYTIAGSGENMWLAADAFQFVWKKVTGDVALGANISFVGQGKNEHRKAVLMIRQSLDAGLRCTRMPALHGNGLTSPAVPGHEGRRRRMRSSRVFLVRRGCASRSAATRSTCSWRPAPAIPLFPAGASIKVPLAGEFYVGIGVCAHDKDADVSRQCSRMSL